MTRMAPPARRLDDGVVTVRECTGTDLSAFVAASAPGGNEDVWLSPVPGSPAVWLAAHTNSWPGGWPVRPALAIALSGNDQLVGVLYITDRGRDSVEMTYGVAPAHRSRGYATRAARLAAAWLLLEAGWRRVELRVPDDAAASQRVAMRSGFTPAGRVRTMVSSIGEEFEDRLYIMTVDSLHGARQRALPDSRVTELVASHPGRS